MDFFFGGGARITNSRYCGQLFLLMVISNEVSLLSFNIELKRYFKSLVRPGFFLVELKRYEFTKLCLNYYISTWCKFIIVSTLVKVLG